MGLQEKSHQIMGGGGVESEAKRWVIAGIPLLSPMKPIFTKPVEVERENDDDDGECLKTPTAGESRIPRELPCPPPPRKRKPSSTCHYSGVREFFTPPDLETVFIRRVERA